MRYFAALFVISCMSQISFLELAHALPTTVQVLILGGKFEPLYDSRKNPLPVKVKSFKLDIVPITNRNFMEFLSHNPDWKKENLVPLFADSHYLEYLEAKKYRLSENELNAPVTYLSWFATQAYCQSRGARLPTLIEWEYAAAASETKKNATKDPEFVQSLLAWYGKPSKHNLDSVHQGPPNAWGVYDLHGLVWEWVADFNSVFVSGDNRREGDDLKNIFCASDSLSANDKANYAAFMRYALRSSLKGNYALGNLGFRCATSVSKDKK